MSASPHRGIPFNRAEPVFLDDQLTNEERMISETAHSFGQARFAPEWASAITCTTCGKARGGARHARDMQGGNDIRIDHHVLRQAPSLKTVNSCEGAHDMHALTLGRAITDLHAVA